jgi:hypothetical protein
MTIFCICPRNIHIHIVGDFGIISVWVSYLYNVLYILVIDFLSFLAIYQN